jgi:hypothetical protein
LGARRQNSTLPTAVMTGLVPVVHANSLAVDRSVEATGATMVGIRMAPPSSSGLEVATTGLVPVINATKLATGRIVDGRDKPGHEGGGTWGLRTCVY